jgi:hypothetical protein
VDADTGLHLNVGQEFAFNRPFLAQPAGLYKPLKLSGLSKGSTAVTQCRGFGSSEVPMSPAEVRHAAH